MRITAADLAQFGIIDEIISEIDPAHERPKEAIRAAGEAVARHLRELVREYPREDPNAINRLRTARYDRFRRIGAWRETTPDANGFDMGPVPTP
jgi:acetyl-CoA carboxylase alpha subunit